MTAARKNLGAPGESLGTHTDAAILFALKSFGQDYPESQRFLLCRGRETLLRDGIHCMPCETFLPALRPDSIFTPRAQETGSAEKIHTLFPQMVLKCGEYRACRVEI